MGRVVVTVNGIELSGEQTSTLWIALQVFAMTLREPKFVAEEIRDRAADHLGRFGEISAIWTGHGEVRERRALLEARAREILDETRVMLERSYSGPYSHPQPAAAIERIRQILADKMWKLGDARAVARDVLDFIGTRVSVVEGLKDLQPPLMELASGDEVAATAPETKEPKHV